MRYYPLGRTGLFVSELSYSLESGQVEEGDFSVALIRYGLAQGMNFIDMVETSYYLISEALQGYPHPTILAGKAAVKTYTEMKLAVEKARQTLHRDCIEVFSLAITEDNLAALQERRGALDYLCDAKAKGLIEAVGLCSNSLSVLREAAEFAEVDLIIPLIDVAGSQREDSAMAEMLGYVNSAGKGVYLLALPHEGNSSLQTAIDFSRTLPGVASVAIATHSEAQLSEATAYIQEKAKPV